MPADRSRRFPQEEARVFLEFFPTGLIQANCTLIGDEEAGVVAVIDPGEEAELIHSRIQRSGLEPKLMLHTHGHIDHVGGSAHLYQLLGSQLPVALHRDELEIYQDLKGQLQRLAQRGLFLPLEAEDPPPPDLWLEHEQHIELGKLRLEVRHTPGHSPGSVCFLVHGAPEPLVIAGDVLFAGSIGRTDLPGGSFEVLQRSIREQLYTLPDETRVITGHGPATTIATEKRYNPFVQSD
jgi:glyoxylase-like metal-dependent hydrolase (beta-lactamase superfamily II)